MVWNLFRYLEPHGSRVWQTDRRTGRVRRALKTTDQKLMCNSVRECAATLFLVEQATLSFSKLPTFLRYSVLNESCTCHTGYHYYTAAVCRRLI